MWESGACTTVVDEAHTMRHRQLAFTDFCEALWRVAVTIQPHDARALLVDIIAKARDEHFYDLPPELIGQIWGGKYRGQRQFWYLARFLGQDSDINIETEHPEFRAWKWAQPETLPDLIVPFKRKLYRDIVQEFRALI